MFSEKTIVSENNEFMNKFLIQILFYFHDHLLKKLYLIGLLGEAPFALLSWYPDFKMALPVAVFLW